MGPRAPLHSTRPMGRRIDRSAIEATYAAIGPHVRVTPVVELDGADLGFARAFVDRVVLVSDTAIEEGQRALWDALRVVAEPGGAAAFSALHCGAYRPAPGERVGAIVSGGNTTAVSFGGPAAGESGRKAPPP